MTQKPNPYQLATMELEFIKGFISEEAMETIEIALIMASRQLEQAKRQQRRKEDLVP